MKERKYFEPICKFCKHKLKGGGCLVGSAMIVANTCDKHQRKVPLAMQQKIRGVKRFHRNNFYND